MASNGTEATVAPKYSACHPVVRIYLGADRSGIPVWDETKLIKEPVGCEAETGGLRLAPGQSRQLHFMGVAPRRLNGSLPPGRYRLSVIFWLGGQAYELGSGEGEIENN